MYIAKKKILVKSRKGHYELREPGEKVPEAYTWHNLEVWLKTGHIEKISKSEYYQNKE